MSNPISPTATSLRPSHGFGRLHPQLRPMAKRRLNPDEIRAAVEAGPPPHSVNYETDKKWHAAQNCWLAKWTERRLPDSGDSGSSRRDLWRDRKQQHARLLRAAEKEPSASLKRQRKAAATPALTHSGRVHAGRHGSRGQSRRRKVATSRRTSSPWACMVLLATPGARCRGGPRAKTPSARGMRERSLR